MSCVSSVAFEAKGWRCVVYATEVHVDVAKGQKYLSILRTVHTRRVPEPRRPPWRPREHTDIQRWLTRAALYANR